MEQAILLETEIVQLAIVHTESIQKLDILQNVVKQNQATPTTKKAYQLQDISFQKEDASVYAFTVNEECKQASGLLDLKTGKVHVKSVTIDSGASCNVVDQSTWEMLKEKGLKCQSEKCEKTIFAYGQTEPIAVLGVFKYIAQAVRRYAQTNLQEL